MKTAFIAAAPTALFIACFASSFIHPWGNPRSGVDPKAPLLRGTETPTKVERVFETKCAACHSEKTAWPGYSRFAPASWLIERDVIEGRAHLNMSRWRTIRQRHALICFRGSLRKREADRCRFGNIWCFIPRRSSLRRSSSLFMTGRNRNVSKSASNWPARKSTTDQLCTNPGIFSNERRHD
jgi:hypothetical protein